jgi:hypothetical protein
LPRDPVITHDREMRSQLGILTLSWMIGVSACALHASGHDEDSAALQPDDIGICGANLDPSSGLVCTYHYSYQGTGYASNELIEKSGIDYVRCSYYWSCVSSLYTRTSLTDGQSCEKVLGTDCGPGGTEAKLPTPTVDIKLPLGSDGSDAKQLCQNGNYPQPPRNVCDSLSDTVEQGEDICCEERKPTMDAGVGLDAGPVGDGGFPDAGFPDAGFPDAGFPDAGAPFNDAGAPFNDAGFFFQAH